MSQAGLTEARTAQAHGGRPGAYRDVSAPTGVTSMGDARTMQPNVPGAIGGGHVS